MESRKRIVARPFTNQDHNKFKVSHLRRACDRLFLKSADILDKTTIAYTLFIGGNFVGLRDAASLAEFRRALATDLVEGTCPMYLNELSLPDLFPVTFDFDGAVQLTHDEIHTLTEKTARLVAQFYPGTRLNLTLHMLASFGSDYDTFTPWSVERYVEHWPLLRDYVDAATEGHVGVVPPTVKGSQPRIGLHAYMPGVIVNNERMLAMRELEVAVARKLFGERHPGVDWANVVDAAIYKGHVNLRMPFSYKKVPCMRCHFGIVGCLFPRISSDTWRNFQRDTPCPECDNSLMVRSSRVYRYFCGTDATGALRVVDPFAVTQYATKAERIEAMLRMLTQCTVRVVDVPLTAGYQCPSGIKVPPGRTSTIASTQEKTAKRRTVSSGAHKQLQVHGLQHLGDSDIHVLVGELEQMIHGSFHTSAWSDLRIVELKAMMRDERIDRYLVHVDGINKTYCLNKGGAHGSNSIYFQIDRGEVGARLRQRCFSKKEPFRNSPCHAFTSAPVHLSASLTDMLFPDQRIKRRMKIEEVRLKLNDATVSTAVVRRELAEAVHGKSAVATAMLASTRTPTAVTGTATPTPTPTAPSASTTGQSIVSTAVGTASAPASNAGATESIGALLNTAFASDIEFAFEFSRQLLSNVRVRGPIYMDNSVAKGNTGNTGDDGSIVSRICQ